MKENEISEPVIGCAIEVHRQLGPGLLESRCLCGPLRLCVLERPPLIAWIRLACDGQ